MKTAIIQKAIILNDDGNILALKRSESDVRRPLQWDLPGGWLDEGESFTEGLVREIVEETGIAVKSSPQLVFTKTEIRTWQEGEDANKQGNCVFLFYLVKTDSQNVTISSEHVTYEWMSLDAALNEFQYSLHKEAINHIKTNRILQA